MHPLFVSIAIADLSSVDINGFNGFYKEDLDQVRTAIKTDAPFYYPEEESAIHEDVDFVKITLQLTSLSSACANLAALLSTELRIVYSLTSQRDNDLNLKISRLTARQNQFNTTIASATRRDSIDMRVIAGVTLVFLPGTFVATLFSSSFWNFHPPEDGRVVSSWIWLYATVTGVLTFIVLALWRYLYRTQYKAMKGISSPVEPIYEEIRMEEGRNMSIPYNNQ
ncbi:hypothetical protein CPB86DRAFT_713399 [Serendipita vermifera]|nr:hypothetical protein CPB86DRAFT_713399 [Serendipita vermifera]